MIRISAINDFVGGGSDRYSFEHRWLRALTDLLFSRKHIYIFENVEIKSEFGLRRNNSW